MIIDGKNAVLGRLASLSAKALLKGEEVKIVNAEKVIMIGDPRGIVVDFLKKREIGSPHHGPFYPKKPDLIVRRSIRGMLPYKTNKGRAAFKKLKVYIGMPKELEKIKMEKIAQKRVHTKFITIGEIAESLGWRE